MTAPARECQPEIDQSPEALLRAWAKAYRDTPEHRFPSDPHAEFFPVDLEYAADRIEELTKALKSARVRIEYLGVASPNPRHLEANEKTFLPEIDRALGIPLEGSGGAT
jgi:hypothetical protein